MFVHLILKKRQKKRQLEIGIGVWKFYAERIRAMYNQIGDAVANIAKLMITLLIIFVPLGLWKLIEIFIWIWNNIHFGTK